jgi:hypothetical protein
MFLDFRVHKNVKMLIQLELKYIRELKELRRVA